VIVCGSAAEAELALLHCTTLVLRKTHQVVVQLRGVTAPDAMLLDDLDLTLGGLTWIDADVIPAGHRGSVATPVRGSYELPAGSTCMRMSVAPSVVSGRSDARRAS